VQLNYDVSIISKACLHPFYPLDDKVKLIYPTKNINYKNTITTLLGRLKVYRFIYKTLKKEKPDVVIPFSTTTNGVIIVICKLLKINVIASEHTNYKVGVNSLPIKIIKRWIYPMVNALTVLTERDKEQYYSKFMDNVVVMHNPLPFTPLDNLDTLHNRDKIVLAVGSVERWHIKGFDNLLKIFSQVVSKHPEWKLKIAGGGNSEYLVELINSLNLSENVELLGAVSNIRKLMQTASIFILTSRWEGLPMVLIEAMSQGMGCVAFDCFTGPRDILTNGEDGFLIEDQNNEKFVAQLIRLIEDEDLRYEVGASAIETSKKYLPHKIAAKWELLFKQVLDKN
jgi:GalNAc-alpha-(1->4)-GalNAc-alpha-(1->3)-diNAcBac-PP-undecaprenol alpha-1,4-N-acetyl-D-galactosaminyltransferase